MRGRLALLKRSRERLEPHVRSPASGSSTRLHSHPDRDQRSRLQLITRLRSPRRPTAWQAWESGPTALALAWDAALTTAQVVPLATVSASAGVWPSREDLQ